MEPYGKNNYRFGPLTWVVLVLHTTVGSLDTRLLNEFTVVGKSPSRTVPDRTYDCDRSWSPENYDFRYRLLYPHKK